MLLAILRIRSTGVRGEVTQTGEGGRGQSVGSGKRSSFGLAGQQEAHSKAVWAVGGEVKQYELLAHAGSMDREQLSHLLSFSSF